MAVNVTPVDIRNATPAEFMVAAASGEDHYVPASGSVLIFIQAGSVDTTVTITWQGQANRPASTAFPAQSMSDAVMTVAASQMLVLPPLPAGYVAQGNVIVRFDVVEGVKIGALRVA